MKTQQFEMAVRLADHATELDEAKGGFEPHLKHAAISVVREMHKLAEALAGERIGEIYAQDDVA